jgi:hypothetical protein
MGILGSQAHDQCADTGGDGGSAGAGVRGGPAAADELTVPAQDRGGSDRESAATTSGEQSGEGGDRGAVAPVEPRPGVRRCRTASWWRRTRISISLAVSERTWSTIQVSSFANIW